MYKEVLPTGAVCPPADAYEPSNMVGYRAVHQYPPKDTCFGSHAALKKKCPPDLDACLWSSCSLFTSSDKLKSQIGLPKLRKMGFTHIVRVSLTSASGKVKIKNQHIDWWRYASFDVTTAVMLEESLS